MAVQSTLSTLPSPGDVLVDTLLNPLLTGPLFFYLRRNPSVLQSIPWPATRYYKLPFDVPFLPSTIRVGASSPLKILKYVFAWGLILYVNRFLSRLALNNWHLKKQGVAWDFDGEGVETVLITGGCSGFGKEMTKMFAERTRAKIVVLDVSPLPEDMKSIPRLTYHHVDLTSPNSITDTLKTVLSSSTPTVLINNAGIATAHPILATTDSYLESIFRVNILSHFTMIRTLLPHMMSQKKGHIISFASMASYTGCADLGDYCATKHAVLGMHESLLSELSTRYKDQGGHCIQASIVHPMWARTPLVGSWEKQLVASKTAMLEPRDVAGPVVDHILRGASGSVFVPRHMRYLTIVKGLPDWVGLKMRADLAVSTDMTDIKRKEGAAPVGVKVEESWVKA